MIASLLLSCLISVTHAPEWSYPVISIETPDFDVVRKDLVVTDGNHVHQVWSHFTGNARIGYNIVLPDGTTLFPDTMLSRDVLSAYPSMSDASETRIIAFWRENSPIWYTVFDHDGNTLIPATMYTAEGWFTWPMIDSSPDSLGRVHMVWNLSDGSVCYSVLDPGVGEVFRDTIPDSWQGCLVIVDGDRIHIKFNGPDQAADYIQYDLDGNVTIPTVSLVDDELDESNRCSITVDSDGNAMVFLVENPDDALPRFLSLYKIERNTGVLLLDRKIIYWPAEWQSLHEPVILPSPGSSSFYLLWVEEETGTGFMRWIKFAIIDIDGNFIEEPSIAYDYSDEDPQNISRFAAAVNDSGDVFAHWSAFFPAENMHYIVLGWFDHNWLGIEEETKPVDPPGITMVLSSNPFTDFLSIEVTGAPQVQELLVYDITGRQVRTLDQTEGSIFFWDGTDCNGDQLPAGTYVFRAESQGYTNATKVVKLD